MAKLAFCRELGNPNPYLSLVNGGVPYMTWLTSRNGFSQSPRPGDLLETGAFGVELTRAEFEQHAARGMSGIFLRKHPVADGPIANATSHDSLRVWTDGDGVEWNVDVVILPLIPGSYCETEGAANANIISKSYYRREFVEFLPNGQATIACSTGQDEYFIPKTYTYEFIGGIAGGQNTSYASAIKHNLVLSRNRSATYCQPILAVVDFVPVDLNAASKRWLDGMDGRLNGVFRTAAEVLAPMSRRRDNAMEAIRNAAGSQAVASLCTTSVVHGTAVETSQIPVSLGAQGSTKGYAQMGPGDDELHRMLSPALATPPRSVFDPDYVVTEVGNGGEWMTVHAPGLFTSRTPLVYNMLGNDTYYETYDPPSFDAVSRTNVASFHRTSSNADKFGESTTDYGNSSNDETLYTAEGLGLYGDATHTDPVEPSQELQDVEAADQASEIDARQAVANRGGNLVPRDGKTNALIQLYRLAAKSWSEPVQ